jgi:hypothetical protein
MTRVQSRARIMANPPIVMHKIPEPLVEQVKNVRVQTVDIVRSMKFAYGKSATTFLVNGCYKIEERVKQL